jgi:uncharacterized protein YjbI with pentapeptide repeats
VRHDRIVNESHLAILKRGVRAWNAWRQANPAVKPNLAGAKLRKVNLEGIDLDRANLRRADFTEAQLNKATLGFADLRQANFSNARLLGADLGSANLFKANLSHAALADAHFETTSLIKANLSHAYLSQADFDEADARGADLSGATLEGTYLGYANLARANLAGAFLHSANLSDADLSGADLSNANLSHAILVATNLSNAKLNGARIYGAAVWDVKLPKPADQTNLIITPDTASSITVDNLDVAQFVYLMLHNEKIRDVLDTVGKKGVLILGRFTPERKRVLDALRDALRRFDFVPIVFDFVKPTRLDFTETIRTLAGLARFIVADITNPKSSPLELQAILPDYMIPFVPIIQKGEQPFAMFRDLQNKYSWVLEVLRYDSVKSLISVLQPAVITPALDAEKGLLKRKTEGIHQRHTRDYAKLRSTVPRPARRTVPKRRP